MLMNKDYTKPVDSSKLPADNTSSFDRLVPTIEQVAAKPSPMSINFQNAKAVESKNAQPSVTTGTTGADKNISERPTDVPSYETETDQLNYEFDRIKTDIQSHKMKKDNSFNWFESDGVPADDSVNKLAVNGDVALRMLSDTSNLYKKLAAKNIAPAEAAVMFRDNKTAAQALGCIFQESDIDRKMRYTYGESSELIEKAHKDIRDSMLEDIYWDEQRRKFDNFNVSAELNNAQTTQDPNSPTPQDPNALQSAQPGISSTNKSKKQATENADGFLINLYDNANALAGISITPYARKNETYTSMPETIAKKVVNSVKDSYADVAGIVDIFKATPEFIDRMTDNTAYVEASKTFKGNKFGNSPATWSDYEKIASPAAFMIMKASTLDGLTLKGQDRLDYESYKNAVADLPGFTAAAMSADSMLLAANIAALGGLTAAGKPVASKATAAIETAMIKLMPKMGAKYAESVASNPAVYRLGKEALDNTVAAFGAGFDVSVLYDYLKQIGEGEGVVSADRMLKAGTEGGTAIALFSLIMMGGSAVSNKMELKSKVRNTVNATYPGMLESDARYLTDAILAMNKSINNNRLQRQMMKNQPAGESATAASTKGTDILTGANSKLNKEMEALASKIDSIVGRYKTETYKPNVDNATKNGAKYEPVDSEPVSASTTTKPNKKSPIVTPDANNTPVISRKFYKPNKVMYLPELPKVDDTSVASFTDTRSVDKARLPAEAVNNALSIRMTDIIQGNKFPEKVTPEEAMKILRNNGLSEDELKYGGLQTANVVFGKDNLVTKKQLLELVQGTGIGVSSSVVTGNKNSSLYKTYVPMPTADTDKTYTEVILHNKPFYSPEGKGSSLYKSGHWNAGVPEGESYLAHYRFDVRNAKDSEEKHMFLFEIQSDLHQGIRRAEKENDTVQYLKLDDNGVPVLADGVKIEKIQEYVYALNVNGERVRLDGFEKFTSERDVKSALGLASTTDEYRDYVIDRTVTDDKGNLVLDEDGNVTLNNKFEIRTVPGYSKYDKPSYALANKGGVIIPIKVYKTNNTASEFSYEDTLQSKQAVLDAIKTAAELDISNDRQNTNLLLAETANKIKAAESNKNQPFSKSWPELVIKDAIARAKAMGVNKISFADGFLNDSMYGYDKISGVSSVWLIQEGDTDNYTIKVPGKLSTYKPMPLSEIKNRLGFQSILIDKAKDTVKEGKNVKVIEMSGVNTIYLASGDLNPYYNVIIPQVVKDIAKQNGYTVSNVALDTAVKPTLENTRFPFTNIYLSTGNLLTLDLTVKPKAFNKPTNKITNSYDPTSDTAKDIIAAGEIIKNVFGETANVELVQEGMLMIKEKFNFANQRKPITYVEAVTRFVEEMRQTKSELVNMYDIFGPDANNPLRTMWRKMHLGEKPKTLKDMTKDMLSEMSALTTPAEAKMLLKIQINAARSISDELGVPVKDVFARMTFHTRAMDEADVAMAFNKKEQATDYDGAVGRNLQHTKYIDGMPFTRSTVLSKTQLSLNSEGVQLQTPLIIAHELMHNFMFQLYTQARIGNPDNNPNHSKASRMYADIIELVKKSDSTYNEEDLATSFEAFLMAGNSKNPVIVKAVNMFEKFALTHIVDVDINHSAQAAIKKAIKIITVPSYLDYSRKRATNHSKAFVDIQRPINSAYNKNKVRVYIRDAEELAATNIIQNIEEQQGSAVITRVDILNEVQKNIKRQGAIIKKQHEKDIRSVMKTGRLENKVSVFVSARKVMAKLDDICGTRVYSYYRQATYNNKLAKERVDKIFESKGLFKLTRKLTALDNDNIVAYLDSEDSRRKVQGIIGNDALVVAKHLDSILQNEAAVEAMTMSARRWIKTGIKPYAIEDIYKDRDLDLLLDSLKQHRQSGTLAAFIAEEFYTGRRFGVRDVYYPHAAGDSKRVKLTKLNNKISYSLLDNSSLPREGHSEPIAGSAVKVIYDHFVKISVMNHLDYTILKMKQEFKKMNLSEDDKIHTDIVIRTLLDQSEKPSVVIKFLMKTNEYFWRATLTPLNLVGFTNMCVRNSLQGLESAATSNPGAMSKNATIIAAGLVKHKLSIMETAMDIDPEMGARLKHVRVLMNQRQGIYKDMMFMDAASISTGRTKAGRVAEEVKMLVQASGAVYGHIDEVNREILWVANYMNNKDAANKFVNNKISLTKLNIMTRASSINREQYIESLYLLDKGKVDDFAALLSTAAVEDVMRVYDPFGVSISQMSPTGRMIMGTYTYLKGSYEMVHERMIKSVIDGAYMKDPVKMYNGIKALAALIIAGAMSNYIAREMTGYYAFSLLPMPQMFAPGPSIVSQYSVRISRIWYMHKTDQITMKKAAEQTFDATLDMALKFIPQPVTGIQKELKRRNEEEKKRINEYLENM